MLRIFLLSLVVWSLENVPASTERMETVVAVPPPSKIVEKIDLTSSTSNRRQGRQYILNSNTVAATSYPVERQAGPSPGNKYVYSTAFSAGPPIAPAASAASTAHLFSPLPVISHQPPIQHPVSALSQLDTLALAIQANPYLAALLLSSALGLHPSGLYHQQQGYNSPEHEPVNPYIALLLSHYGRYLPRRNQAHGIYAYTAANNIHNARPFGAYKIYEDRDN